MKGFEQIVLDVSALRSELNEFEILLNSAPHLRERKDIAPFFKSHHQIVAALGLFHSDIAMPDRFSSELSIFGDFVCDATSGDAISNAYLLVEFEDANPCTIFDKAGPGKVRTWSSRFEHGSSQLLDWAWRLDIEAKDGVSFRRIFEKNHANIHFLLIAGRDADLTPDDVARVRWRSNNVSFGGYKMSCLTFDGVLNGLRRRFP